MFALSPLPRTLAAAVRDVSHRRFEVRLSALHDLGRLLRSATADERQTAITTVTRALETDEAPGIRAEAAVALADAEASEAVPALLKALDDVHLRVQEMAVLALGEVASADDAQVREALRLRLKADAPAVRFQALNAFFRVAPADAQQAVLDALHDSDAELRALALRIAEILCGSGRPMEGRDDGELRGAGRLSAANVTAAPAPQALVTKLLRRAQELLEDSSERVRLLAALALGRAGASESARVLSSALNARQFPGDLDDEQFAIELAWQSKLTPALPGLRRRAWGRLGISSGSCAFQARVALARLGDQRARRFILARLDAWSRDARNMAVVAAGAAGLVEARERLERLRAQPERVDPESLAAALASLDAAQPAG